MTDILGSEHVYDCRLILTIQKDLLPPFSGRWNCLGRHLGVLWPTSHLKIYLRVLQAQSKSSQPCFFNHLYTQSALLGCDMWIRPVLTEFLFWLRVLTWGKISVLMVVWGLNTDWICCAGCRPSWPGCGGLWSQVGWGIARAQENAVHMESLLLFGALRAVVYYPRGAYPEGALALKMEAACVSRISVCLPTKPRTLSFNLLIKVNIISLTQVAACHTHACTCTQF
jgi:hypothetical protein